MELSLSTCSLTEYLEAGVDRRVTLQAVRDCGFTCVDFEITEDMLGDNLEQCACEIKEMLKECGLTAPQGHAPIYNPLDPPEEIDCIKMFEDTLRFCQLVGIPQVVIHPGAIPGNTREDFFEKNVAFYQSLIPAAEATGVVILIENIGNYADPYFLWTGADLREMIDRVDHPLFGACWDVGHANHFWPEDAGQYDSIMALGDKLTALHVHENCGYFTEEREHNRIDMHTIPYFTGRSALSFDEILLGLRDVGYKGTFNFETVFPAKKNKAVFQYRGRTATKLQQLPLNLWQKYNAVLFETGKYMLETYALYSCGSHPMEKD